MAELPPADEPTLRYDPEIGPGYFTQIRNDFLRFGGYSPTMKVLYLVLLTYCGAGDTAFPGQDRLAAHCGVSERTIRTTVDELEAAGLLTVTRRGLNKTNLYYVHKFDVGTLERQSLPVKAGKNYRPKPAVVAAKKESVQTHTVETDRAADDKSGTANAEAALAGALRWARVDPAAGLAAWRAAGCPPYLTWLPAYLEHVQMS